MSKNGAMEVKGLSPFPALPFSRLFSFLMPLCSTTSGASVPTRSPVWRADFHERWREHLSAHRLLDFLWIYFSGRRGYRMRGREQLCGQLRLTYQFRRLFSVAFG